jgi:RNA polymerase sigma-70 factor (ECF subfamily)
VGAQVAGLFDEHSGMVLGLCRLLLRDHHEAEDAAQQTFVSAYRSLLRGTEPRDPGPWLAAIARNECRARLRKRMRAPIALEGDVELELSDTSDLAELADRRAEMAQLASEIAKLPSRQREAIALRDFLGLSYEEVASTLKVSVPVVESLLFRARRRLRDTVRTVPRYAAGLVLVPIALRAAVARDIPDFDAVTVGLGIAGIAGAAAGGVAKLMSLPASVKVAATVAVVATGSVVAPTLIAPSHEATPAAVVQGEPREAGEVADVSQPALPAKGEEPSPGEVAGSAAKAPSSAAEPAAPAAAEPPAEVDPGRISAGTIGGAPLAPPPPPPADAAACTPPAGEDESKPAEACADDGAQPAEPPVAAADDGPQVDSEPAPGGGPQPPASGSGEQPWGGGSGAVEVGGTDAGDEGVSGDPSAPSASAAEPDPGSDAEAPSGAEDAPAA